MGKVMAGVACGALAAGMVVLADPDDGVAAGGGGRKVSIEQQQFVPLELTVGVGDEVTWTHRDGKQVHSVTADDGFFDSNPLCSAENPKECMSDHDTFQVTFGAEGRFPYFSKPHGGPGGQGASGVIVVMTAPPPAPKKGSPDGSATTTTAKTAPGKSKPPKK